MYEGQPAELERLPRDELMSPDFSAQWLRPTGRTQLFIWGGPRHPVSFCLVAAAVHLPRAWHDRVKRCVSWEGVPPLNRLLIEPVCVFEIQCGGHREAWTENEPLVVIPERSYQANFERSLWAPLSRNPVRVKAHFLKGGPFGSSRLGS